MYFVVRTKLDQRQIDYLLQQIAENAVGSAPLMKNGLINKQKLWICPCAQKIYTRADTYCVYVEVIKSKAQKAITLMTMLESNQCSIEELYIVSGAVDLPSFSQEKKVKKFTIIDAAPLDTSSFVSVSEIKCKDKQELAATIQKYQCLYHLQVQGLTVKVFSMKKEKVKAVAQNKVTRMFKKMSDSLKTDYAKLQSVLLMSYGVM